MLLLPIFSLIGYVAAQNTAVETRPRRQSSYTIYYLCGNYPNQYISYTPCNNNNCPNCNPPSCNYRCSSTQDCRQFNSAWTCQNGCCRISSTQPTTRPPPVCGGREVSGGYCRAGSQCDSGFLCTSNNVCCRCQYGTSTGPCVNQKCPDNHQCNSNNECCPYEVGK